MCSCFTSSQADPSVTSRSPEARRDPAASRWARRRGAVKTLVVSRGQVSRTQARHRAARAETEGSQGPERSTSGGCRRPPRAHGSHGLREPGDGRSQTAEPQGAVTAAGLKSPAWYKAPGGPDGPGSGQVFASRGRDCPCLDRTARLAGCPAPGACWLSAPRGALAQDRPAHQARSAVGRKPLA